MPLIYDNDEYINKPLYSIIVLLIYLVIFIYIIIFVNSIYNFIVFIYNESYYKLLISEKENLSKNIKDSYHYRILNYINCFDEKDNIIEDKKNLDMFSKITSLFGLNSLINANNNFSNEKDFSLLFEYNLYNIIFKIIIIIVFIIFFSIAINFFINFFLRKKLYTIIGQDSVKSYITLKDNNNSLIITITYIFVLAVLIYLVIYKIYFIDKIYNDIYNIYKSILQLDSFILDEANKINKYDSYFFIMLKNIVITKDGNYNMISTDNEKYIIENNIELTENQDIKISKYLILGFYKYIININEDIDIVNKINTFIIYKNSDLENNKAISLRDFLPISINKNNIENKINDYFNFNITNTNVLNALDKKKESLIYILQTLDNKLEQNNVVYNIIYYIIILIIVNIFIVFLLIYFIYRNDYDNAELTTDKDNNFRIIKDSFIGIYNIIISIYNKYFKD